MILTEPMVDLLDELRRIEPARKSRALRVPESKLGNALIHHYYETDNLLSREIIKEIMSHAGVLWLRKLIMKNRQPMEAVSHFSSLNDYIELAAANDPVRQFASIDYRLNDTTPWSGSSID